MTTTTDPASATPGDNSISRKKIMEAKIMDANVGNPVCEDRTTMLPRGGVYVETSIGPIQYGIPPETIKDCMSLGIGVPQYFIVPTERFSTQLGPSVGINVAEFEFPAYFNFFFKRRSVNLIVANQDVEDRIREVFQETLFGPKDINTDGDYTEDFPQDKKAQLHKELTYFRKFGDKLMTIDMLLSFTKLNNNGEVTIQGGENNESSVKIAYLEDPAGGAGMLTVAEGEKIVARFEEHVQLPAVMPSAPASTGTAPAPAAAAAAAFDPPQFGITVLGNSHGFDSGGSTSGYVLWLNRRGIMIDPPPRSTLVLEQNQIPPSAIDGVIVTHCHADHDAGTFQKILMEGKVMLITTQTIHDSFVRKYSALSGLTPQVLTGAFNFRRVRIGERVRVRGAELAFNYMLHSIPCVGLEVWFKGKSVVFSADHMNDSTKIPLLHQDGILSDGRRDDLLNFPWQHDIILHEAGVPPIHTPIATLEALDDAIKERLYVVHVAAKDIPPGKGLRAAPLGVAGTLTLPVSSDGSYDAATDVLALLQRHPMFGVLPFDTARDVLTTVRPRTFSSGEVVMKGGAAAEGFCLITIGEAITEDGTVYRSGDLIGEACILDLSYTVPPPAHLTVSSPTPLSCLWFDHVDLHWLLRNDGSFALLTRILGVKDQLGWEAMNANKTLSALTDGQKFQLEAVLHQRTYKADEEIWAEGSGCGSALLVAEGTVRLMPSTSSLLGGALRRSILRAPSSVLGAGAFIGDFPAMVAGSPHSCPLMACEDSVVLEVNVRDMLRFFERNPGVLLAVGSTVAIA